MSDVDTDLARLAEIRTRQTVLDAERTELYAERRTLFARLRDAGVEHKVIAKAAGVTVPAVIQQTEKARDEAASHTAS